MHLWRLVTLRGTRTEKAITERARGADCYTLFASRSRVARGRVVNLLQPVFYNRALHNRPFTIVGPGTASPFTVL